MDCDCISDLSKRKRCLKEQIVAPRYVCMRPFGHVGKHLACHGKTHGIMEW